jgi:hypothetical protein
MGGRRGSLTSAAAPARCVRTQFSPPGALPGGFKIRGFDLPQADLWRGRRV